MKTAGNTLEIIEKGLLSYLRRYLSSIQETSSASSFEEEAFVHIISLTLYSFYFLQVARTKSFRLIFQSKLYGRWKYLLFCDDTDTFAYTVTFFSFEQASEEPSKKNVYAFAYMHTHIHTQTHTHARLHAFQMHQHKVH